jgi:hypothetical protein
MRLLQTFIVLFVSGFIAVAQVALPDTTAGIAVNHDYEVIDVNRLRMWVGNNGLIAFDPLTPGPGLEWPAGQGTFLVYNAGLVVGGRVHGDARVGGATSCVNSWQAGDILPSGAAANPEDAAHRIYRARPFEAVWWEGLVDSMQTRFLVDLMEWPVESGAPWVDTDGDGRYNPDTAIWRQGGVTDAPLLPGDEVLYFVGNDLDSIRMFKLYGSSPMGLEMRTMVWASAGHPVLENVVFRQHTLINRSDTEISDMYIGSWEDMDIGDGLDDFCGIDSTLALAYAYNGASTDLSYGLPPASGVLWLQTPAVPHAGTEARFGLSSRKDHINLPLSGYAFYINGSFVYRDPVYGQPEGATQMLNNLMGFLWNGAEAKNPLSGQTTRMPLAGDPVLATGWTDGIVHPLGDRRAMSSSGPFTLAPGDTQTVLIAQLAADGRNHLLSVRDLRNAARQLHDMYRHGTLTSSAPVFSAQVTHPTPTSSRIQVSGGPFPDGSIRVMAELRTPEAVEGRRVTLHDNGAGGDVQAGDGIYSGVFDGLEYELPSPAELFIITLDDNGEKEWFVDSELPTAGLARVRIAQVLSDSRNSDGKANPGENLRLSLRFENHTDKELGPWHLFLRDSISLQAEQTVLRHPVMIEAGGFSETPDSSLIGASYLQLTVPDNFPAGTSLRIPVVLMTDNGMLWPDTLSIHIHPLLDEPDGLLRHVEGLATGTLGYSIVNPEALTNYDYRISVEGEDTESKTLHVENVSLGVTLSRGLPLPDRWGHNAPVIDGWRLNMGSAFDAIIHDDSGYLLPHIAEQVEGVFSETSRAWFAAHRQYPKTGASRWRSSIDWYDQRPVRLVFDGAAGQKALCYQRGATPHYTYQGYFDVPVRAYDISDTTAPRRLMIAFTEHRNTEGHDNTWMPLPINNIEELLLIFLDDYADAPASTFFDALERNSHHLDILYCLHAYRNATMPAFEDGDSYDIRALIPVSKRDVYIFPNPRKTYEEGLPTIPTELRLHPNYPNPFGAGSASGSSMTSIRFDLPDEGFARIIVHDVLGRQLRTLFEQTARSGTHTVRFDGAGLPSGTYIISLEADGARTSRTMMLLH